MPPLELIWEINVLETTHVDHGDKRLILCVGSITRTRFSVVAIETDRLSKVAEQIPASEQSLVAAETSQMQARVLSVEYAEKWLARQTETVKVH